MGEYGSMGFNALLSLTEHSIDFRKFVAWTTRLNLAELRIVAVLILSGKKNGLNRLEISSMVNLSEVMVANSLEDLRKQHIVKKVPRSRKDNPIKDIKKKEMDYITPVNRYFVDWARTPFPEGVKLMKMFQER